MIIRFKYRCHLSAEKRAEVGYWRLRIAIDILACHLLVAIDDTISLHRILLSWSGCSLLGLESATLASSSVSHTSRIWVECCPLHRVTGSKTLASPLMVNVWGGVSTAKGITCLPRQGAISRDILAEVPLSCSCHCGVRSHRVYHLCFGQTQVLQIERFTICLRRSLVW